MYIESVSIKNIRSIESFNMAFKPPYAGWHVVIGDNGAGKSTFVKAVSLALIGPDEATYLRQDWRKWTRIGLKGEEEKQIELGILIGEKDPAYANKKRNGNYKIGVKITENPVLQKAKISSNRLAPINENLQILDNSNKDHYSLADYLLGYFSAAYGPFRRFTGGNSEWDTMGSYPRAESHISAFGEDVTLGNCVSWLKDLRTKSLDPSYKEKKEAEDKLNCFVSFINNGKLLPHESKLKQITTQDIIFTDINNTDVSLQELSDGYRSVLSMTFELIRKLIFFYPNTDLFANVRKGLYFIDLPGVVIIDEIDAHLHPSWQVAIGNTLTRLFPQIQFIVTTHSPLICRAADNGSIWRLAASNNKDESGEITGTQKTRLIKGNILDAYGTEIFGGNTVRSIESQEDLERLGELNMLFALGKISEEEKAERLKLKMQLPTDDPSE